MFHTEGRTDIRTDMTKLTVALRNFANAPKTVSTYIGIWVTIVSVEKGTRILTFVPCIFIICIMNQQMHN